MISPIIFYEVRFSHSADRTFPIFWYILKFRPGWDTTIRITLNRIINIPANNTAILFHDKKNYLYNYGK